MSVLVTGGAGYIGAHVVEALVKSGRSVAVVDDLSTGNIGRIPDGIAFHQLDLATPAAAELAHIMTTCRVSAVVHLAAKKQVLQSVEHPESYLGDNVSSLATVIKAIRLAEIPTLVFSSSASVYGTALRGSARETDAPAPLNPYGRSKLVGEWLTKDAAHALGLNAASLRYFNVAGASSPRIGDRLALNLIPMIFERLDAGLPPRVFGSDYETSDGTCVRDYVHVSDLADAHVSTLEYLERVPSGEHQIFNVGTGRGTTVLEIIDAVRHITGLAFQEELLPRRAGDPAAIVADPTRIRTTIGWTAGRSLDEMVTSAWAAWRASH
ncbi:MAG TPA: UDP-glucose 4-epimerase GalE [Microbacteriaceae bacterium]|nr:UDP-glucose 4-epimerase GalE [Microbacteriaceae bacterium]